MLKVGYVDNHNLAERANYNTKGILQISFTFAILNNIFLYVFDEYIV